MMRKRLWCDLLVTGSNARATGAPSDSEMPVYKGTFDMYAPSLISARCMSDMCFWRRRRDARQGASKQLYQIMDVSST